MLAMALTEYGGPEVLRLMDLDVPEPGPGQVRVRVRAAGVMPFDTGVRQGVVRPPGTAFPIVPGNEFAGTVDAVGSAVTAFAPGTDVLGFSLLGAYAQYVVVGADQLVAKPDAMDFVSAGGFSGNAQGAHMALSAVGVRPGDTVLVSGAAGGFGTQAVQLARAWGATTVIGTASPRNHDHLRALGAVPVTYGEGLEDRLRALAPDGVDAAVDGAGPEGLRAAVAVAKDRERVATMLADEEATRLGVPLLRGTRTAERLAEITALYAKGLLRVHLRAAHPLQDAAAAHRAVESGHGRGKVVLRVD
ncbi:NADP-dependent oxidoreductase [Streptomyces spectabilis]|uniref:NADP-dependent oxidoreductase n=1 Tax=Streptomyces spectabilis TaxID=68270 RepID=A0A5P2X1X6_STRST|nr:NADP-dependent oxidoreductase [Streptomyces spectabilis]MBB5106045.1 NADPH:quinone reductase-like Zn-dependent oxidoreductase [Streptomyces spectabilis]MCI3901575.1 NADP-dependent oxidoreductase [Streptomyces spectabilis]QEV59027.1 NADP-dependent oxidoreductase [Streptomyces spectabilis]GGV25648.1 oxidoreductase [Streptomyces spectabilis]